MNLGIIGFGNIGKLIYENLINNDFNKKNKIFISNKKNSNLNSINIDLYTSESNLEIAKKCDVIIICVKTPQLLDVLKEIKPNLNNNKQIIHTCAGIDFKDINKIYDGPISCVIPSIASTVVKNKKQNGISIFYHCKDVNENSKKIIEDIFSKFSYIINVDNFKDLKLMTITTSCMPAFITQSIGLLSEELSRYSDDIDIEEFNELLYETIKSTTNILNSNTLGEKEIIEKVSTKNGITQKGLIYLKNEVPTVIINLINKLI